MGPVSPRAHRRNIELTYIDTPLRLVTGQRLMRVKLALLAFKIINYQYLILRTIIFSIFFILKEQIETLSPLMLSGYENPYVKLFWPTVMWKMFDSKALLTLRICQSIRIS